MIIDHQVAPCGFWGSLLITAMSLTNRRRIFQSFRQPFLIHISNKQFPMTYLSLQNLIQNHTLKAFHSITDRRDGAGNAASDGELKIPREFPIRNRFDQFPHQNRVRGRLQVGINHFDQKHSRLGGTSWRREIRRQRKTFRSKASFWMQRDRLDDAFHDVFGAALSIFRCEVSNSSGLLIPVLHLFAIAQIETMLTNCRRTSFNPQNSCYPLHEFLRDFCEKSTKIGRAAFK